MIRLLEDVLVVDASAMIELLRRTPAGVAIEQRLLGGRVVVNAPELFDVEVAQVLRRYVQRGMMSAERAKASLDIVADFPIRRHSHGPLMARVWELRENLTAYDAAYVALTEGLRGTLITRDAKLAESPGHTAQVELI